MAHRWEGGRRTGGIDGRGLGRLASRLHREDISGPDIVMPHRVRGVPEVTREATPNGMHTERAMNREGDVVYGSGRSDLERTSPLGTVGGFRPELLKDGPGIGRHEPIPVVFRDVGQPGADRMCGAAHPPSHGMVQTVSVSRHPNDRPRMSGLPEPTV